MEEPRGRRVVHPPLMRTGLAALAVPAILGLLAVPGLLLEAPPWPLVVLMFVGFPLVLLAGEDGLAVGVMVTAAVWAPIVGVVWWTVGQHVASDMVKDPAGFTWAGWAGKFARVAPVVLVAQTMIALLFVGVLMTTATTTPTVVAVGAVLSAVAIVLLLRRDVSAPSVSGPSATGAYGRRKQCLGAGSSSSSDRLSASGVTRVWLRSGTGRCTDGNAAVAETEERRTAEAGRPVEGRRLPHREPCSGQCSSA